MSEIFNIPIKWDKECHRNLKYETTNIKDAYDNEKWQRAGHNLESITLNVHQFNGIYPWMEYLSDYFKHLKDVKYSFNLIKPGHYLPSHIDRYGFYKHANGVEIVANIKRYIIFLEEWEDGHFLTIEDKVINKWKVGDTVSWIGETPHAAINLGLNNRYTLQVTGHRQMT